MSGEQKERLMRLSLSSFNISRALLSLTFTSPFLKSNDGLCERDWKCSQIRHQRPHSFMFLRQLQDRFP